MFSRPSINASIFLEYSSLAHESYIEQYARDDDFKDAYETLIHCTKVEELDYNVDYKLLYRICKLCIPMR
jgi:hypothetical protein